MFPLNAVLKRFVRQGRLKVTDCDGKAYEFGDPDAPLDAAIALRDPDTAWRIAVNGALNIGEAYTDGTLVIEEGSLLDFLRLLLLNSRRWNDTRLGQFYYRAEDILRLPAVFNPARRSRANVKHHYDLSDELFSLFLDKDRQYSCAYYQTGREDIDSAQLLKKQHIAAKLYIRPDQHILDIGSGWGGLALYLAEHYPVRVTGLTLSEEQFRVSNARARQLGLAKRVAFKLLDYRREQETYDRIVSVGMFEHVGKPHFSTFFRKMETLLKPDGVALIHTIGFQTPPTQINSWLRRYIFPGAYLPSLSQLAPIFERQHIWLTDFENLRLHYALTLAAWHERFQAHRDRIASLYDGRFCRMWEFYLQSCEVGFRWGGLTVFQLQLAKDIAALPITRDYMIHEEQRLRAIDEPGMEEPAPAIWAAQKPSGKAGEAGERPRH
ncbi:MAG: class I SAM-dependent methyltransferase [Rhodomicrobium sp.]|nr:class I SAM-dependent methyltransferase [Rhodomicrobium sp.]